MKNSLTHSRRSDKQQNFLSFNLLFKFVIYLFLLTRINSTRSIHFCWRFFFFVNKIQFSFPSFTLLIMLFYLTLKSSPNNILQINQILNKTFFFVCNFFFFAYISRSFQMHIFYRLSFVFPLNAHLICNSSHSFHHQSL